MPPQIPKDRFYFPLVFLVCLTVAILSGLSIFSILKTRENYLNEAITKSKAQAQMLGENASSLIYNTDLTLLAIQAMITNQGMDINAPPVPLTDFIKHQLNFLPQIDNIVIFNAKKEIRYHYHKPRDCKFTTFEEHRDTWTDFALSIDPISSEKSQMIISRRLENPNAEFAGMLAAVVDQDVFYKKFENYLNIDVDAIGLFDAKGTLFVSWFNNATHSPRNVGANARALPLLSMHKQDILSKGGRQTYTDGDVIVSTFQLPGFPLQIAVAYEKKNVLQKWRQEATLNIGILGVTTLLLAITLFLSFQQRKQRRQAEMEILQYQGNLEETVRRRTVELTDANVELQKTNTELKRVMAEAKTLGGLLPICSYCKKIRDDRGYWNQLETYIHDHSDAEFSHGICPDCAKKYFPEFYDKKNE